MKEFKLYTLILLAGMLYCSGCSITSASVSQAASQVGSSVAQSAAYATAKQTVENLTTKIGLTPQQAQQILPMLQNYYTQIAGMYQNSSGGTVSQKLTSFKNNLVTNLKTSLTADQIAKAIALI